MANAYKYLVNRHRLPTTLPMSTPCPSATESVISTIMIANRAATSGTFRLSVRPEWCRSIATFTTSLTMLPIAATTRPR
jgi:hypothetical protein